MLTADINIGLLVEIKTLEDRGSCCHSIATQALQDFLAAGNGGTHPDIVNPPDQQTIYKSFCVPAELGQQVQELAKKTSTSERTITTTALQRHFGLI